MGELRAVGELADPVIDEHTCKYECVASSAYDSPIFQSRLLLSPALVFVAREGMLLNNRAGRTVKRHRSTAEPWLTLRLRLLLSRLEGYRTFEPLAGHLISTLRGKRLCHQAYLATLDSDLCFLKRRLPVLPMNYPSRLTTNSITDSTVDALSPIISIRKCR